MSVLDRFDIRTILACQILLSAAFAVVFFAMSCAYRNLSGIASIAVGFFLNVPGILLLTMRGSISDFNSVVLANALILVGHLYLYVGVLRFYAKDHKPRQMSLWIAYAAVVVTILLMTWFTEIEPSIVARILAVTATSGLISTLLAVELIRRAQGRRVLRLFACFLLCYTAGTVYRAVGTAWLGAPPNFLEVNSLQAASMTFNVVFISALGIFFQLMIASELNQAVESRARQDLLTGVFNRLGIEERLSTELDRAQRNKHPLSAVLIDIDYFKAINDSAGHAAGDDALRLVSKGILTSLRSYDLLGRYGGDEFLLLLPETTADNAIDVADRIRQVLSASAESLAPRLRPTVSIGVAEHLLEDNCTTLLARADAALYDAKQAGRNCVRKRDLSGIHPILIGGGEHKQEEAQQREMVTLL
ncbi:GGDEF domain-containing protein [soil metagenome]